MIRCIILSCILILCNSLLTYGAQQDTLLSRIHRIKQPKQQVVLLNNASETCWQTGHYKKGISYANKGLAIARKYKLRKLEGKLLNNLGIIYDYKGDYPKSLKYYFTALRIQEKINDLEGQAYSMSNI